MFWADQVISEIIKSGKYKPYHVDDMKTPSGRIHVGALRGVVVHGLLAQVLKEKEKKVKFTWVFNDMDPMDGFPHYLQAKFKKYMGWPLFKIPSPQPGYDSMAQCYAQQFIEVFEKLGFQPEIIWTSQWYQQGKFNEVIKEALDKKDQIRQLYKKVAGYNKSKNWYPLQVICPQCGKVGTTIVYDWDGKKVKFHCKPDLVSWAQGCDYKGEISPFDGQGKLMWKVDWPAHWKTMGVTVEWAGKDHMSEGGSYDLSSAICEKVFDYPKPYARLYEWFLARGGSKMSSSKGVGVSAQEISDTLPPEILRFLLVRPHHKKAIIFDPFQNETILDLFDEYDRFSQIYYTDPKNDFARVWQLSQIEKIPSQPIFLPRFRDVVNYVQLPSVDVEQKFIQIKGSSLNAAEKKELQKRIKYARIWLRTYAPEKSKIGQVRDEIKVELSAEQKKYLSLVLPLLEKKWSQPEELQQALFDLAKGNNLNPRDCFQAIYLTLTGEKHGPKAAWFLLEQDKKLLNKRFKEASK